MKAFETEKHNIPEGATHHGVYGCDTIVYFKGDDGVFLGWKHDNWSLSSFPHHKWVKPIQTEPKYRYEKLEFEFAWQAARFHEEGGSVYAKSSSGEFYSVDYEECPWYAIVMECWDDLYQKIEISERDLFIEKAREHCHTGHSKDSVLGKLFDAGCRFEK